MKNNNRLLLPFVILFIILNGFFISGKTWLAGKGINQEVLIAGNLILAIATVLSFWISYRAYQSSNPNASVRSLYGSFMVKFFLIIIAAFVYILFAKKNVNKPALIICAALYIVYTYMEVSVLTKLLKQKKNA